ncbi:MAG: c-type cytochrome [Candidatus Binataceae bacterium]
MATFIRLIMPLAMSVLLLIPAHASAETNTPAPPQAEGTQLKDHCQICHDRGMIAQQRLTPTQWQAEVKKMRGWGSPLPANQEKPLADYLAAQYPAGAAPATAPESSSIALLSSIKPLADPAGFKGDAATGQSLFTDACASCHGDSARGGEQGPNLVQRPILYRFTDFKEVVMKGRRTMPAFTDVLDPPQVDDIVAWLRTLQTQ